MPAEPSITYDCSAPVKHFDQLDCFSTGTMGTALFEYAAFFKHFAVLHTRAGTTLTQLCATMKAYRYALSFLDDFKYFDKQTSGRTEKIEDQHGVRPVDSASNDRINALVLPLSCRPSSLTMVAFVVDRRLCAGGFSCAFGIAVAVGPLPALANRCLLLSAGNHEPGGYRCR